MRRPKVAHSREDARVAWYLIELVVYGVFVLAYYYLALHYLGGWLKRLSDDHRTLYAFVALALIAAQGVLLQLLTGWLLAVIRGKAK
jgi:hypothetical protein